MKIIADIDIPFVKDYFAKVGTLVLKPGRLLTRQDLSDADVLLLRSITKVDATLLQGTPVKFVASVSTGADHLDTAWLAKAGIQWATAAGYNAKPVSDYVMAIAAALNPSNKPLKVGVIGVGRVGGDVASRFKMLGYEVFLCDPPRAQEEKDFHSFPLSALQNLDLLTLHTPLVKAGSHPTYHLLDAAFLSGLNERTILINTSRGAVIDSAALAARPSLGFCLDVWENEPAIDLALLSASLLATPHMAGYSQQGLYRGIAMIYQAFCKAFDLPLSLPKLSSPSHHLLAFDDREMTWQEVVLRVFNPLVLTAAMKDLLLKEPAKCATLFDQLRQQYIGSYTQRQEFSALRLTKVRLRENDRLILGQLGFTFI